MLPNCDKEHPQPVKTLIDSKALKPYPKAPLLDPRAEDGDPFALASFPYLSGIMGNQRLTFFII